MSVSVILKVIISICDDHECMQQNNNHRNHHHHQYLTQKSDVSSPLSFFCVTDRQPASQSASLNRGREGAFLKSIFYDSASSKLIQISSMHPFVHSFVHQRRRRRRRWINSKSSFEQRWCLCWQRRCWSIFGDSLSGFMQPLSVISRFSLSLGFAFTTFKLFAVCQFMLVI